MKKIFVMAMILSSFLYSTVYENGDDGSVNRWVAQAGATVSNVTDDDTGSKVIKFSDSAYKYYRMENLATNSDNKIEWDIKTDRGFIAYVYVSTTNGDRLFYYTILNRDYGVTSSGIHHGLGEDTADGEWHTITRDLDSELHESEPSNNVTSIKWFKLRAIDDTFVDNIIGSGSPSPSPSLNCSVIEDAEDGTTNKWTAPGVTVTNEVDADTGSKVIKLSSDAYKYSRIDNLNNSAKKIEWDIKTNRGFIAYVNTSTSNGNRLFYYTILNRDYGVTSSGIHHGLGEDKADGEWHTITRDLDAELHESEPSNNVISINSFKIRAIGDTFIDNIKGCGASDNNKNLKGNIRLTIEELDKQTNEAKVHIVTDISEADYVFDNNKSISMYDGTVQDGYIILHSGRHHIKVCSDEVGTICSFEQGILVSHNIDKNKYKKYPIEISAGGLTNNGTQLVYGGTDGNIYRYDFSSESSTVLASTNNSSWTGGLAYVSGTIYYFSKSLIGNISKIDTSTENITLFANTNFPDGLDIFNNKIYAVTNDRSGILSIFDLEGKKIGSLSTTIPDITGITHTSKYLYILSEDGNVFQVSPITGKSNRIFTNDNLFTKGNNYQGLEAITVLNNYIYVSYIDDVSIYKIDINLKEYE